jgi:hypothetical protein
VIHPNQTSYTWRATQYGADTIGIEYTDPHYVWSHGSNSGIYYISVYAYENTTFTITASMIDASDNDTSHDVILISGQPQTGFLLNRGSQRWYTFLVGERADVTITITPRYGDPDLYVRPTFDRPFFVCGRENHRVTYLGLAWCLASLTRLHLRCCCCRC